MIGEGKYDAECTSAREATNAEGLLLVVIDGERGSGFSCQCSAEILVRLPAALRHMAASIEGDVSQIGAEAANKL